MTGRARNQKRKQSSEILMMKLRQVREGQIPGFGRSLALSFAFYSFFPHLRHERRHMGCLDGSVGSVLLPSAYDTAIDLQRKCY
jgi:hypothetical protein